MLQNGTTENRRSQVTSSSISRARNKPKSRSCVADEVGATKIELMKDINSLEKRKCDDEHELHEMRKVGESGVDSDAGHIRTTDFSPAPIGTNKRMLPR